MNLHKALLGGSEPRVPMRSRSVAFFVGLAVALVDTPAHAAQIVQSVSLTDDALMPIDSINVDRFDLSLGTLTGVSADIRWGGIGFLNVIGPPGTGYRLAGAIQALATTDSPLSLFAISFPFLTGTLDASGAASRSFDGIVRANYAAGTADLDGFVGPDPIRVTFSQDINLGVLIAGGTGFAAVILPTGRLTMTYDYTPATVPPTAVPEPAAWLTMVAGFGLLGSVLRRKVLAARRA